MQTKLPCTTATGRHAESSNHGHKNCAATVWCRQYLRASSRKSSRAEATEWHVSNKKISPGSDGGRTAAVQRVSDRKASSIPQFPLQDLPLILTKARVNMRECLCFMMRKKGKEKVQDAKFVRPQHMGSKNSVGPLKIPALPLFGRGATFFLLSIAPRPPRRCRSLPRWFECQASQDVAQRSAIQWNLDAFDPPITEPKPDYRRSLDEHVPRTDFCSISSTMAFCTQHLHPKARFKQYLAT